jgi:hypothetical protein
MSSHITNHVGSLLANYSFFFSLQDDMKLEDESDTSETNTDLIAQSLFTMEEKEEEEAGEEEDEQEPHYSNLLPTDINLPSPPPMLIQNVVSLNGTSYTQHSENEYKRRASESDDQPTTKLFKITPQNGEPYLSEQSSSITEPKSAQIIDRMKHLKLRISSLFGKFDEFHNDIRQISTEFEVLVSDAESIL